MSLPFLRQDKIGLRTQETFIGKKCEIYLPTYFFNKNDPSAIAVDLGERIQTQGLFWYNVDGSWYELNLPLKIQFEFSEVSGKTKKKFTPDMPEGEYYIYTLKNGDAFIYDIQHRKDVSDLKDAFIGKMIEYGKLPPYISYDNALETFINAMEASDYIGIDVTSVSIEFLLSELYRNRRNNYDPFRLAYNGKNPYDYKMVRITKVPELNSTFQGMISEDINSQVVSSVLKYREGVIEKESPMEKIIKY